jgi:hypothetical protein
MPASANVTRRFVPPLPVVVVFERPEATFKLQQCAWTQGEQLRVIKEQLRVIKRVVDQMSLRPVNDLWEEF